MWKNENFASKKYFVKSMLRFLVVIFLIHFCRFHGNFAKLLRFWSKSLMFPHCVDVSAVVFQSKCPKMSQLLHMTDQSITKLWLEPGSPKSFGKKHFHSKCYTYARREGGDWKKKWLLWPLKEKNRNRRLSDPRFLSRRKEYLENQGGPVCHLCLVKQKRSNFHLILVNWN